MWSSDSPDGESNDTSSSNVSGPRVFVVAEKPSVAKSFEKALRGEAFLGFKGVEWLFGATYGHILDLQFDGHLPQWDWKNRCYHVGKQGDLFTQGVSTFHADAQEAAEEDREPVAQTLIAKGSNADFVLLCLDNDLEGESIASEVHSILHGWLRTPQFGYHQQFWRCRFSSLDSAALQRATNLPPHGSMCEINTDFVGSVEFRKELDLRLGFSFSRAVKHLVWNVLQRQWSAPKAWDDERDYERILRVCQDLEAPPGSLHVATGRWHEGDADRSYDAWEWPVLSYGPCQLPTLGFIERNAVDISTFQPGACWKVRVDCVAGGAELVAWSEPFRQEEVARAQAADLERASMATAGATSAAGHGTMCLAASSSTSAAVPHPLAPVRVRSSPHRACQKPKPLNTPAMLLLASDCLGLSPDVALSLAQDLYLAELITYPRSETTVYDPDLDLEDLVTGIGDGTVAWRPSPECASFARDLLSHGLHAPRHDGMDMGDHAPVMPVKGAGARAPRRYADAAASLYDLIVRVFLASVAPDAQIEETELLLESPLGGRGSFRAKGTRVGDLGWITILPVVEVEDAPLPKDFIQAAQQEHGLQVQRVSVVRFEGECPKRLTEAGLLELMDAHGIGTDASMPQHVKKIIERRYAKVVVTDRLARPQGVQAEYVPEHWYRTLRDMYPTSQGSILYRWFMLADEDLVLPSVRANVEATGLRISRGEASAKEWRHKFNNLFRLKFEKLFMSYEHASICEILIRFMRLSPQERQRDPAWQRAESLIRRAKLQDMAEQRKNILEERRARPGAA